MEVFAEGLTAVFPLSIYSLHLARYLVQKFNAMTAVLKLHIYSKQRVISFLQKSLSEHRTERMIIEEFERSLLQIIQMANKSRGEINLVIRALLRSDITFAVRLLLI